MTIEFAPDDPYADEPAEDELWGDVCRSTQDKETSK